MQRSIRDSTLPGVGDDARRNAGSDIAVGVNVPGTSGITVALSVEDAVRASTPKRRKIKLAKKKQHRPKPEPLTIEQILAWADAHHEATGKRPHKTSGPIAGTDTVNWAMVQTALRTGTRGMTGGSTLARLLAEYRGVRNLVAVPHLSIPTILQWADTHHAQTGQWPGKTSGEVVDAPGETWTAIDAALLVGCRGLPGGSSLPRLLADSRGVRNLGGLPPLSLDEILRWIDAYRERTGAWPTNDSGHIDEAQWDTWRSVDVALCGGNRGLPGGSSLVRLLAEHRGRSYRHNQPPFSIPQILGWAEDWRRQHGSWPLLTSGPIFDGAQITWTAVHVALQKGLRGLPGGSSLPRLLAAHRGVANRKARPRFTIEQVLEWADHHKSTTGRWPTATSGQIADAPDETWSFVNVALYAGCRGIPGGSSLAALLADRRR